MEIHRKARSVQGRAATQPLAWLRRRAHRLLLLAAGVTTLVSLGGFHALLLWQRVANLTLLEPEVALRWLAALLLLWVLLRLRRAGVPLLWGRKALVFWLLVLLLHAAGSAPVPGEAAAELAPRPGAALLFVLPAALTALELGRRLLEALAPGLGVRFAPLARGFLAARAPLRAQAPQRPFLTPLAPRPPPL